MCRSSPELGSHFNVLLPLDGAIRERTLEGARVFSDETMLHRAMEILQANGILLELRSVAVARDKERHPRPVHVTDQDALLLFNAHHEQFPSSFPRIRVEFGRKYSLIQVVPKNRRIAKS